MESAISSGPRSRRPDAWGPVASGFARPSSQEAASTTSSPSAPSQNPPIHVGSTVHESASEAATGPSAASSTRITRIPDRMPVTVPPPGARDKNSLSRWGGGHHCTQRHGLVRLEAVARAAPSRETSHDFAAHCRRSSSMLRRLERRHWVAAVAALYLFWLATWFGGNAADSPVRYAWDHAAAADVTGLVAFTAGLSRRRAGRTRRPP